MSQWKVILATLLIFGSGIGTGVLLSKRNAAADEPQPNEPGKFASTNSNDDPRSLRPVFFRSPGFLDRHLDLTESQKEQVQNAAKNILGGILKNSKKKTDTTSNNN